MPGEVLWLGLATVPFQLLNRLFSYAAKGVDRFDIRNWATIGQTALRLLALGLAWLLAPGDPERHALGEPDQRGGRGRSARGTPLLRHTGLARRVNLTEIRASLKFGLETTAQTLAGDLHQQVDILIMGPMHVPGEQIALYSIAAGLIQQLRLVPDSIALALFPKLSGSNDTEAVAFTTRVCRHSTLWVLVCSVGLGAIVPFGVPLLYGDAYSASLPSFFILLPAMALLTVYRVVVRYFISRDRQRLSIVTQLAALVVNVGLNLVLMPGTASRGPRSPASSPTAPRPRW